MRVCEDSYMYMYIMCACTPVLLKEEREYSTASHAHVDPALLLDQQKSIQNFYNNIIIMHVDVHVHVCMYMYMYG